MYGLPEAGILTEKQLNGFLAKYGYFQVKHIPGLWQHTWGPITSCLTVDEFSVKCISMEHAQHLSKCL